MDQLDAITVTHIREVITVPSPKTRPQPMVKRPSFGLSFCTEGEIRYTHKGRVFVSRPDVAVLLPKDATYQLERTVAGHFPLINFQCAHFAPDTFIVIPLREPERYWRRFARLQQYHADPRNHHRAMEVFYEIQAMIGDEQRGDSLPLQRALFYLQEHCSDPQLRIADAAAHAAISEVWLRRQFAAAYGMSPKQYVLDRRLSKAQQLLTEGSLSVTQVAEECGFAGIQHFCRCFKGKTGTTPTAYANEQRRRPL